MSRVVFIGDEVTGAGFRLAGVLIHDAEPEALPDLIHSLKQDCEILMMTTDYASRLPKPLFDAMTLWTQPLVVFIPDIRGTSGPLDLEVAVRRELGIGV